MTGWNAASPTGYIRADAAFSRQEVVLGDIGHYSGPDADFHDRHSVDLVGICGSRGPAGAQDIDTRSDVLVVDDGDIALVVREAVDAVELVTFSVFGVLVAAHNLQEQIFLCGSGVLHGAFEGGGAHAGLEGDQKGGDAAHGGGLVYGGR